MTGIKIPVTAAFEPGDTDRALDDFKRKFNSIGSTIAQANKTKFNPVDKVTIEDMRKVVAMAENLRKVSSDFNKRLKATGQGGSGFMDIDWSKLYPDQNSRARQMQKAFEYVGGGGRFGPGGGGGGSGGGGGGGGPYDGPNPADRFGPSGGGRGGYARNIAGAGLNALGAPGRIANSGISAGMSSGIGAGLGVAAGMAAIEVLGAIKDKIEAAQTESIGYDTLKRTLGDVNVSFNVLRDSLRASSRGLDMTFEEGQKLGIQFAKMSNMNAEQYRTLADEVKTGGGFGRSFGVDPNQSTAFFAQMRLNRVTDGTDEKSSKRLALLIGESIAKGGAFSKADEVLEAIANYTTVQTRMGMNPANTEGYASYLTGMMASKIPGMDPGASAALLGRVNASISGGGGGEAGQNFMYSAIGSKLGLDPLQTALLREQGAFGTGKGTFGKGSMYEKYTGQEGPAADSTSTNLQLIMEKLDSVYEGKNPLLKADAMSRLFGTSMSQAMALSKVKPAELGGLSNRFERLGINLNDVSATGISRVAQLESSLPEGADKDRQIREAASQNQEKTEGTETRATINGVKNAVQEMATKSIPLMNDMRSALMMLAGDNGKRSPLDIKEAIMRADFKDRFGGIAEQGSIDSSRANKDFLDAKSAKDAFLRQNPAPGNGASADEKEAWQKKVGELVDAERSAEKRSVEAKERNSKALIEQSELIERDVARMREEERDRMAGEADQRSYASMEASESRRRFKGGGGVADSGMTTGGNDDLFKALLGQESGGKHRNADGSLVTSAKGAEGIAQVMPKTGSDPGFGVTPMKDNSQEESMRFGRDYLNAMLTKYGGDRRKALAAYNGGPGAVDAAIKKGGDNWLSLMPDETQNYVPSILSKVGTPIPGGSRPGDQIMTAQETFRHRVDVGGTFHLTLPNGQQAAPPVQVAATRVGPPQASGSY